MHHCPDCGAFTKYTSRYTTLGTRPDGTRLLGILGGQHCTRCGYRNLSITQSVLDYATAESEQGRLTLNPHPSSM